MESKTSNDSKQKQYLKSIVFDLNKQLGNIEYQIKEEKDNIDDIEKLILHYKENKGFILDQTTLNYFGSVFDRTTYGVSRATYTELVSTGDIRLLANKTKNAIIVYYQDMERRKLIIQKNNDVKDYVLNPIFFQNIDLSIESLIKTNSKTSLSLPSQLEQTNSNLLDKNRLFEVVNIIKLKWKATYLTIDWLSEDHQKTLDLIALINNKIEH